MMSRSAPVVTPDPPAISWVVPGAWWAAERDLAMRGVLGCGAALRILLASVLIIGAIAWRVESRHGPTGLDWVGLAAVSIGAGAGIFGLGLMIARMERGRPPTIRVDGTGIIILPGTGHPPARLPWSELRDPDVVGVGSRLPLLVFEYRGRRSVYAIDPAVDLAALGCLVTAAGRGGSRAG